MQRQYNWIMEQLSQGKTVLAYDRKAVGKPVAHLKSGDRVTMQGDVLFVGGKPANGWTFAVKP